MLNYKEEFDHELKEDIIHELNEEIGGSSASFLNSRFKDSDSETIHGTEKALESSNGEIREAMDWLRKHGAAKASSKLAGRDATEGLVGVKVNAEGTKAAANNNVEQKPAVGNAIQC